MNIYPDWPRKKEKNQIKIWGLREDTSVKTQQILKKSNKGILFYSDIFENLDETDQYL